MDRLTSYQIPFNKPIFTGDEIEYIIDAVTSSKQISGNGKYTRLCHDIFTSKYGIEKCLLTHSCTAALEMAAILLNIKEGDEVIMPSYTFVSTANAFILRGARIVFVDSRRDHPGIDEDKIEYLVTKRTKAVVVVHYAGVACNMDKVMALADKYNLFVVEDAAQAVDSYFTGIDGERKALGSIGHLSAFSFHETKNISCGEGGMLVINDPQFIDRAEVIWEKGTNRAAFHRGEVGKYQWVDIGSSFLPSELTAAFLYAQLEKIDQIQERRKKIWNSYKELLSDWATSNKVQLPSIPDYAMNNAHMFYMVCENFEQRNKLLDHLKKNKILAVFHYLSLHSSPFYSQKHDGRVLSQCDHYANSLVRLPLYYDMMESDIRYVANTIQSI
ncbi:dTDP-4-amino-4,6-dideoxygalactose transaminase [Reichenbachiella sp. MALMAid0571]|uniref:dTDP-4-amino-4,6-dideoxygalactose transaminase n=1 Tax=Reichenbachiella sp. MALMAid0571 TaxID=3143939 RepID=UPI0032DF624A